MCVGFYEVKFIDLIWAYNLKLLMRKTLSRVLGWGEELDKWVGQSQSECWLGHGARRPSLPRPVQLDMGSQQAQRAGLGEG